MKQPPDDRAKNFEASKFSGDGFLGSDPRPVDEIIADDTRDLEQAGISRHDLVAALEAAYKKTRDAFGAIVEVAPGVQGEFFESRGRLPCPFRGCGVFEKGEASLMAADSRRSVIITSLGIHMIAAHGFFQGRGSRFRIEPIEVAILLGADQRRGAKRGSSS
jgi:hypothetical protein